MNCWGSGKRWGIGLRRYRIWRIKDCFCSKAGLYGIIWNKRIKDNGWDGEDYCKSEVTVDTFYTGGKPGQSDENAHRERLLYGTESKTGDEMPLYSKGYYGSGEKELYALEEGGIPITGNSLSSFKIRLVLAAALFCVYLVADAGEGRIGGISTEEMREEMNKDFDAGLEEVVFDFEDSFPYTLFK